MQTRKAAATVDYNGAAFSRRLTEKLTALTYTDNASGAADELTVTFADTDESWLNGVLPVKGDSLAARIEMEGQSLDCGSFTLDEPGISGEPIVVSLSAVSKPADEAFSSTKRTVTWENVSIEHIAGDIAGRAGLSLIYDAPVIYIASIEQSAEDGAFLADLCKLYGLVLKIFGDRLIVFDRDAYKKKPAVADIDRLDMAPDWDWKDSLLGAYTGGTMSYSDPKTEETIEHSIGVGPRLLTLHEACASRADAELKLQAAINEANHGMTTISFTLIGRPDLSASQCINITGLGLRSGKYYIDKITHDLSGASGYTSALECSRCGDMVEGAIIGAITRLADIGVIEDPDYWQKHVDDMQYLGDLLSRLGSRLRKNARRHDVATTEEAITVLAAAGIIETPEYWTEHAGNLAYLPELLIRSANAL